MTVWEFYTCILAARKVRRFPRSNSSALMHPESDLWDDRLDLIVVGGENDVPLKARDRAKNLLL